MQVTQFVDCWRLSYLDASVWLITFLTVVVVAIDVGLAVGVVLSLACIFIRGMKPYTCLLGHVPHTDLYLDVNRYKSVRLHICASYEYEQNYDSFVKPIRQRKFLSSKYSTTAAV